MIVLLIALKTLLSLVGLLALIVAAVLLAPLSFRGRAEGYFRPDDGEWGGWARWEAEVRWGGVVWRMRLRGTHLGLEEKVITFCGVRLTRRKRAARKPARTKPKKKARRSVSPAEIRSYVREAVRLVRRLTAALRLRLEGQVRFGFEDPSLTGLTLGALAVVGKPAGLHLQADWLVPGLEGWGTVRGRIHGIEVALALWAAYWRSPLGHRLRRRFTQRKRRQKRVEEAKIHDRAG